MPLRTRFRLATLLALTTLLAVFMAYSQIRMRGILREVAELGKEGVNVAMPHAWWRAFWLPAPNSAMATVNEVAPDRIQLGPETYSTSEADQQIRKLRRRLEALGVEYFIVTVHKFKGGMHQLSFALELGEQANDQYSLSKVAQDNSLSVEEINKRIREQNTTRQQTGKPYAAGPQPR